MRPLPALPEEPRPAAASNRPRCCALHRAYPPALVASTLVAALFCYLYLTKPLAQITPPAPAPAAAQAAAPAAAAAPVTTTTPAAADKPALLHRGTTLPGDPIAAKPEAASSPPNPAAPPEFGLGFEETNVRIQHALSADGPDGELGRILLEVPVLYESRRLRWTPVQLAQARQLLDRLRVHQENLRAVRQEGSQLLAAWNHLIDQSIPDDALRADSPSLPVNQAGGNPGPSPAGLDTSETIRVSSSDSR